MLFMSGNLKDYENTFMSHYILVITVVIVILGYV